MFEQVKRLQSGKILCLLVLGSAVLLSSPPRALADEPSSSVKGQRVFSAGHSFHYFMPPILADMAKSAGINEHDMLGLQALGGSRVIQHWNVPDGKNKVKEALKTGKVDVLTLSPIHLPDEGIENFLKLALEDNPKIRVTVQELWLPFDILDKTFTQRPKKVDHNAATGESLRKLHAEYFETMDEHVRDLNKKYGKHVYVVPVGQAVIALREKIIDGKAFTLKQQEDLFTDPVGHAKAPLMALVAYCHYGVIYRRTPVGLPVPAVMKGASEDLNRLLQELAWDAVIHHPLSGVMAEKK